MILYSQQPNRLLRLYVLIFLSSDFIFVNFALVRRTLFFQEMAYRRSVITRGSFLARRIHPSFGYISHDEDRKQRSADSYQSPQRISDFLLRRSFGSKINTSGGFGAFFQGKGFSPLSHQVAVGSSYSRYMSTAIGEGSENIGVIAETPVDLIANATVDVASEVSIAAADSFFLVGILQHLIGGVHSYTGLSW